MADPTTIVDTLADVLAERGTTDRTDSQLLDRLARAYDTYRMAPQVERTVHCAQCGAKVRVGWTA